LFHTYNHPTNLLLFELVRRLFILLGIPQIEIGSGIEYELLGSHSIPPALSVYNRLDMKFNYPKFVIHSKTLTTKQAMEIFIASINGSDIALHNKWIATIKYGKTKLQ